MLLLLLNLHLHNLNRSRKDNQLTLSKWNCGVDHLEPMNADFAVHTRNYRAQHVEPMNAVFAVCREFINCRQGSKAMLCRLDKMN